LVIGFALNSPRVSTQHPPFLILYMRINKTSKRIGRGKGSFGFGDPVETNGPISLIASQ
jgi:hypothetical protein